MYFFFHFLLFFPFFPYLSSSIKRLVYWWLWVKISYFIRSEHSNLLILFRRLTTLFVIVTINIVIVIVVVVVVVNDLSFCFLGELFFVFAVFFFRLCFLLLLLLHHRLFLGVVYSQICRNTVLNLFKFFNWSFSPLFSHSVVVKISRRPRISPPTSLFPLPAPLPHSPAIIPTSSLHHRQVLKLVWIVILPRHIFFEEEKSIFFHCFICLYYFCYCCFLLLFVYIVSYIFKSFPRFFLSLLSLFRWIMSMIYLVARYLKWIFAYCSWT